MKKDEMINVNFMEIVHEICTTASTDCRSLNKSDLSRKLMDLVNIPQNAEIQEFLWKKGDNKNAEYYRNYQYYRKIMGSEFY